MVHAMTEQSVGLGGSVVDIVLDKSFDGISRGRRPLHL